MREFLLSNLLKLRLEDEGTHIYIYNPKIKKWCIFNQCKYLLINIDKNNLTNYDSLNSIDEIIESSINSSQSEEFSIDSEQEFWGHCSNLQAWIDNDYDTRILHSNLSFPLLKRLAEVGDQKAKLRYKEEIIDRIEKGTKNVLLYLCILHIKRNLFESEELPLIHSLLLDKTESFQYNITERLEIYVCLKKLGYDKIKSKIKEIFENALNKKDKKMLLEIMKKCSIFKYFSYDEKLDVVEKFDKLFSPHYL